jgi:hypothetical protein
MIIPNVNCMVGAISNHLEHYESLSGSKISFHYSKINLNGSMMSHQVSGDSLSGSSRTFQGSLG